MKAILEHWRQILRFSLLACCLLFFVPQYVQSSTVPVLIRDAVFLVSKANRQERKQLRRGTIFHVGGGYYRTAAHVVENSLGEYEGTGFDEWAFFPADEFGSPRYLGRSLGTLEVVCVDARWRGKNQQSVYPYDSALLRSSYAAPGVLATAATRPAVGERVSVWGFALTTIMFESGGSVESISDEWIRYLPGIGMPQVKGHSGSPMLDANKTVIGIEAGGERAVGRRGLAVPIWQAESGCPREP